MKIIKLKNLPKKDSLRIINRAAGNYQDVIPVVKNIMEDVKQNGDQALIRYFRKFNGISAEYSIQVSENEIRDAYKQVDKQLIKAVRQMIKNITAVQKAQLKTKKGNVVTTEKGISIWRQWRPIEKVGIYIPGGKATYPSSVLINLVSIPSGS